MGFEGDYIIDYNDSELVNYRNEVALVAAQEFIPLINGAFYQTNIFRQVIIRQ